MAQHQREAFSSTEHEIAQLILLMCTLPLFLLFAWFALYLVIVDYKQVIKSFGVTVSKVYTIMGCNGT